MAKRDQPSMDISGSKQDFPVKVTRIGVFSIEGAGDGAWRVGRLAGINRDCNKVRRMFKILRSQNLNDKPPPVLLN